jgi:hypothetical protein
MEGTGRFSASNWSKINYARFSDCRLLVLYKGMKMCGRNFLLSDFGDVLAILATTSRAMDKWISQLDLASQKGLNSTSISLLVIADSCCTTGRI